MKDGRFVSNWNDFGDYVMEHVTEEDQGGYSCLASSSAGLLQSSVAYMTVNGENKFFVALVYSKNQSINENPIGNQSILGWSAQTSCARIISFYWSWRYK